VALIAWKGRLALLILVAVLLAVAGGEAWGVLSPLGFWGDGFWGDVAPLEAWGV
jgi:hypothetical protein